MLVMVCISQPASRVRVLAASAGCVLLPGYHGSYSHRPVLLCSTVGPVLVSECYSVTVLQCYSVTIVLLTDVIF